MDLIVVTVLALWALSNIVFAIYMARTTWHAQNRQADMERLLASAQFSKQPETAGLASELVTPPQAMRAYEGMRRVPLAPQDLEEINQEP